MEFNSLEDLITYYKEYGKKCGFGVMTKRTEMGDDETVRYVTFACARGGKARNRTLNVVNPHPTGKTECKAKINALKTEGKFRLTTVHNIHNHSLSPKKSWFFQCNRKVSDAVKRVLDTNDLAGIRMNKSFGSLVVGGGRFENLPFLKKDCRNYIDKARHLRLGAGGAGALQEYFSRMQYKNPEFFSLMDLDDDRRYGMPSALFVGVNQHGQSILLEAGLISSEDIETFVWLFQTWLQCMDGIPPKAIITDQDRVMKNAIAIVFPISRHRFCLWHILKKVPEKLGSYGSYKSGMKSDLMKCVYDTQSVEDFEKYWDNLITTYNLHENVWLQSLYTEREHWVPAFLKEYFWTGMNTTQRSESMNAFFDGYVHAKTNSKESPTEKRFQDLYTNAKFREVQQKVTGIIDMDPKLLKRDGAIHTYLLENEVRLEEFTKMMTHYVDFTEEDASAKCSCGLFEMGGILCRHILTIITHATGLKSNTEDATTKLYAMIDLYSANQEPPSMTQTGSNVGCTTKDTTTIGSSKQVLSPSVVRGKGRPPSLRRASRMENDMRKAKVKTKSTPGNGKRKEHNEGDTPVVRQICRNLFLTPEIDMSSVGGVQTIPESTAIDINGTQNQETMFQSQESLQFGLDGSQPKCGWITTNALWVGCIMKFVIEVGHPKKGRPGFFVVFENFSVASTSQKQNGMPTVCLVKDGPNVVDDDDDDILR
ncbi:protein FAR1-RELATED SEQUENCE 5-like [Juglans microcarpa x Juglans regia]|uniref:protein FAR1-RELATED SEQUENCE 5-like n=1 Tax=Juglans microcarpa x Juglans regia TaxID=2249226 RepID=UPI001B7F2110|nr:protein FAR1-RELATED SEQUENCE 5-like [Juglans microcarpa x Juglans regia]